MTRLILLLLAAELMMATPAFADPTLETSIALSSQFTGDALSRPPGEDFEVERGLGFRAETSYWMSDYFGFGPHLSYYRFNQLDYARSDIDSMDVGLSLRSRLPMEDLLGEIDVVISPNLQFGYQRVWDEGEDTDGLAVNIGLDFDFHWENGVSVFVAPRLTAQPADRKSNLNATFGPTGQAFVGLRYQY